MSTVFTTGVDLTTISCGGCGGTYAINKKYHNEKHEAGGYWNCPYCKGSWGFGKSEISRKNDEITRLKRQVDWKNTDISVLEKESKHHQDRARSIKGHLTRTKNRIKNGVCPCCKRNFANLKNHMKCKHPDYSK